MEREVKSSLLLYVSLTQWSRSTWTLGHSALGSARLRSAPVGSRLPIPSLALGKVLFIIHALPY